MSASKTKLQVFMLSQAKFCLLFMHLVVGCFAIIEQIYCDSIY